MVLQTRKPTGLPSWPVVLLGGREKAGKTWTALHGSTSPLVGRTLYIGIGEDDPDEYSAIPGADFDIVLHDGTYAGIRGAVEDAVAEPRVDGKPTLIVLDSATRAWNLIVDNAQAVANRKAKGRQDPLTGDYSVTPDLWNAAAAQWAGIINPLLRHQGPVVVTARIDNVMVMRNGQPTQEKEWKIQGHKTLPFDASAVVEMHERGHFLLTGVRSARIALPEPRAIPEFSLPWFWELLGLAAGAVGERSHSAIVGDSGLEDAVAAIQGARTMAELQKVWGDVVKAGLGKEPELIEAKDIRKHELSATPPADATTADEAPVAPDVAPDAAPETTEPENTSPAEGWPTADVPADEVVPA
ncbi:hypothetical protein [Microbacterium sp. NPDC058389]|uniref:hypothetical protein n=1 Tax=Microbacterium sp. NPDC058389 TaxID=3346475 RepID=UPI00365E73CF